MIRRKLERFAVWSVFVILLLLHARICYGEFTKFTNWIAYRRDQQQHELQLIQSRYENGPFIYPYPCPYLGSKLEYIGHNGKKYDIYRHEIGGFVFYGVSADFWKYFADDTDLGTKQPKLYFCKDMLNSAYNLKYKKVISPKQYTQERYKKSLSDLVELCQILGAKRIRLTHLSSRNNSGIIEKRSDVTEIIKRNSERRIDDLGMYETLFFCDFQFSGNRESDHVPLYCYNGKFDEFKDFFDRCNHKNRSKQEEITLEYTDYLFPDSIIRELTRLNIDVGEPAKNPEKYYCTYTISFED